MGQRTERVDAIELTNMARSDGKVGAGSIEYTRISRSVGGEALVASVSTAVRQQHAGAPASIGDFASYEIGDIPPLLRPRDDVVVLPLGPGRIGVLGDMKAVELII